MSHYETVALGGTFDIIHKGHMVLLTKAFSISSHVIIGLAGDELVAKKGKKLINNYSKRLESLTSTIQQHFPNSSYTISKLENDFGPAAIEGKVDALVVSTLPILSQLSSILFCDASSSAWPLQTPHLP